MTEPTTDWLSEPGVQEALNDGAARDQFDPEYLAACIRVLSTDAADLNTAALGSETLPWTDLVTFLDAVRDARKLIATIESNLETRAARAMVEADVKETELDGVGSVVWRRGKTRKEWKHEALAKDIIDGQMVYRLGETPDPYEVRDWLMEAAHIDYWRVKALEAHGLDPDDYAVSIPGRVTVTITKAD